MRREIIDAYGGKCYCCGLCGEINLDFLCLDHINRDGYKDGKRGRNFYLKLKRAGFPDKDKYRVACHNCNMARESNGGICPHAAKQSKGINPKDLLGNKKVSITKFPAIALAHAAHAMMNGAAKYGAFNWRGNPVIASIYIDACMRHLNQWFDGEEIASDSGVHHLGHAIACVGILLDAQETGNLVDDRPVEHSKGVFTVVLERLAETIRAQTQNSLRLAEVQNTE